MQVWFNNICNEHHPFLLLQTILMINDRSSKTQNIIRFWHFLVSKLYNVVITRYVHLENYLPSLELTYPIQKEVGKMSFLSDWWDIWSFPGGYTIGTNPNFPFENHSSEPFDRLFESWWRLDFWPGTGGLIERCHCWPMVLHGAGISTCMWV